MYYKGAKLTFSKHMCVKCLRTKEDTCPFKGLRHKITNCSSFEYSHAEKEKRRWAKFEE